jgi:hypothetical protein
MTFLQFLLAVEYMQTMARAEAGIREEVIGYYGEPDFENEDGYTQADAGEFIGSFGDAGPVVNVKPEDLPEDIREIYLAEMHRLKTGEVRPIKDFQTIIEGG